MTAELGESEVHGVQPVHSRSRREEASGDRYADSLVQIGAQLRQARIDAHLSLREFASRSGLSSSFLSLVERGESSLSLTSLFAVAEALGLEASALLNYEAQSKRGRSEYSLWRGIDHANEHFVVGDREYFPFRPGFDGQQFEPMILRVQPTTTMPPHSSHEGEEFGLVLSGILTMRLRTEEIDLSAGDAIHFPSTVPHSMENKTDRPVEAVWIMNQPWSATHNYRAD
jgi:transcriptional regulator with XRE-family HTH domain